MSLEGVLTMNTKELKRLSVIEKVIDKKTNPSNSFRAFRSDGEASKAFSKKI